MIDKLKGKVPDKVLAELPMVFSRFRIDTPVRLAHFLGQASHESGEFTLVRENLNYSADALLRVFPKYFNATTAPQYARNPEKIANRVYGGRMGNGPESSGDGYRYCGRGYIQLTGKSNYGKFDTIVDDDILGNPDLVAVKYPLLSAAWFWGNNNLNLMADRGVNTEIITQITKRINGGVIGLDSRIKEVNKFHAILS